jgi:hypothetical protein
MAMLKKSLSREESLALATDLGLTKYIDVDNLIESLQIGQNKETNLLIVTSDKEVAECMLKNNLGIDAQLQSDCVLKMKACYGNSNYSIMDEYGELSVDVELLKKTLSSKRKETECTVEVLNEKLKNLSLMLVYTPEYSLIDKDSWRYMMLEADKTIIVFSGNHILYTGEREFIHSQVIPFYSPSRLIFGIGNAQYIKSKEWPDAVARIHMHTNEGSRVFPIFTEELSKERFNRYEGSDVTLDTILEETQQNLIDLRKAHFDDIDAYKSFELETSLVELKSELERKMAAGRENASSAEIDQKLLSESRKRLESNISLFLESPLLAKYRTALEQFAELLKDSLREDIQASANIKQDARSLPRYLSAIWEQFSDYQNIGLYNEFEREVSVLIDMMNIDLRHVTRNIRSIEIDDDIKKQLDSAFNVHTFFARKTNPGNSLTDALTIGGLLASLFVTPYGIAAILASEIVKIAGKESIDNEYKKALSQKITDVVERNKEELLRQADQSFALVAESFRKEIMNYYDEIIASVNEALNEEKERLAHATETIEIINELI